MTSRTRLSLIIVAVAMMFVCAQGNAGQDQDPSRPKTPDAGTDASKAPSSDDRTSTPDDPRATQEGGAVKPSSATDKEEKPEKPPKKQGPQLATFGAGCFWCTEAVFQSIPGVRNVVSGYSGGNVPFPTYDMVCSGLTGHAEVVQILFDPDVVSYEKLLEVFWKTHDPTTPNAQGPDFGTQYRSIILYHDEDQKEAAQAVYRRLKAQRVFRGKVVTQLEPFRAFFAAEPYHQDYFASHPYESYSMTYIVPKLDKLRSLERKAKKAAAAAKAAKSKAKPKTTTKTKAASTQAASSR